MVWGCMCFNGVGTLTRVEGNINAEKYINMIDNNLWPVIVHYFPDDNAPVHRACTVHQYMENNNIHHTEWPARSPDINPM